MLYGNNGSLMSTSMFDPSSIFSTSMNMLAGQAAYEQALLQKQSMDKIYPRQLKFQEEQLTQMMDSLELSKIKKAIDNLEELKAMSDDENFVAIVGEKLEEAKKLYMDTLILQSGLKGI